MWLNPSRNHSNVEVLALTNLIVSLALLALLTACTDSNNNNSDESFLSISNPTVEDPPDEGTFPIAA
jgi:hypothetical protein